MFDTFITELHERGSVTFAVRARPGMGESKAVKAMDDESIKIDVAAPAEGGKANAELIRFLAGEFSVKKDQVKIISGAGVRLKLVRVSN